MLATTVQTSNVSIQKETSSEVNTVLVATNAFFNGKPVLINEDIYVALPERRVIDINLDCDKEAIDKIDHELIEVIIKAINEYLSLPNK